MANQQQNQQQPAAEAPKPKQYKYTVRGPKGEAVEKTFSTNKFRLTRGWYYKENLLEGTPERPLIVTMEEGEHIPDFLQPATGAYVPPRKSHIPPQPTNHPHVQSEPGDVRVETEDTGRTSDQRVLPE